MTYSMHPMKGKICLITGATAGIGLITARELARLGATVIIVGRATQRGRECVESIAAGTGNSDVQFLAADLSSMASVRLLARAFLAKHQHLHVLVNNAGALFALRRESVEGIEMTLALNHLGPFLLTSLLLEALKAAAPARIINVASEAHEDVAGFDFDDPQAVKRTAGLGAYPRSEPASLFYSLAMPWAHPALHQYARTKLANILFTKELSRRLAGTGVTANALHPGVVASNFADGNGVYGWFMRRFMSLRGISVEEGAATTIYLGSSPDVVTVSGQYFVNKKPAPASAAAMDAFAAAKLWQLSESLTIGT